jgi:hypothetical protein
MKITGRLRDDCPSGDDCARIHDTDSPKDVIVQGPEVTDPAVRARLRVPDHENLVTVPRDLVAAQMMTLPEMGAWLRERHTRSRIRIENRRAYGSVSDGDDFARYLDGAAEPLAGADWHQRLREDTAAGRRWAKVHIIAPADPAAGPLLSDYERYEFEWGFTRTTDAGERVRILHAWPGEFTDLPDFTVVDRVHVVRSVYDDDNRFVGGYVVHGPDAVVYRLLAGELFRRAQRFDSWWAEHPEVHRRAEAA